MKTRGIIILLLVLVAIGAAFYGYKTLAGDDVHVVISPRIGPAVQAVYASGTVEPSVMVPLSARFPARLMSLMADEGQAVVKDQVLAQLEDTDMQKSLVELQASAALAEKEFKRKEALKRSGAVSRQSYDAAKTTLEQAQARVAEAQAALSYMQLVAPNDGIIIRRDGEIGEMIAANQTVFWLQCCAPLRIVAEVDEEDIPLVAVGQKVLVRADSYPGEIFEAKVSSITPKGDPVARSYRVRMMLDADSKLMTGMTTETNIIVRESEEAFLLPATAVKEDTIWVVDNGKAMKRQVKIGSRASDVFEIIEGVSASDMVLKEFPQNLEENSDIKTKFEEAVPAS